MRTLHDKNTKNKKKSYFLHFNYRIVPELLTVRDNPNATYWNVEDGYQLNDNTNEVYPRRVMSASLRDSMETMAKVILDNTFNLCGAFAPGFLLSLHMPVTFLYCSSFTLYSLPKKTF